jgi:hypothetical protein
MQDFYAIALPYLVKLAWFILYLVLVGVAARKTQVEGWVNAHPNWAFALRFWRSIGPDPLLMLKALRERAAAEANVKGDPQ